MNIVLIVYGVLILFDFRMPAYVRVLLCVLSVKTGLKLLLYEYCCKVNIEFKRLKVKLYVN